jgi:hypothetical protein
VQGWAKLVGDIKIKQFGPSDITKASCTITKEGSALHMTKITDAAQTLRPADSVLLTCLRELKDKNIDGVTYKCTDETIFSIATSGTTKSIKIPKICNQTIEKSRADQLKTQIDEIAASIKNVAAFSHSFEALSSHAKICLNNGTGVNCNADCNNPNTEIVISGMCSVPPPEEGGSGTGSIQNFGLSPSTNVWHCLWVGNLNKGRAVAFCLPKSALN